MVTQHTLMGYALSFASFLLDSAAGNRIRKVILFGSVARGDYNNESDIDLFIDGPASIKKEVEKSLVLFRSSKMEETWRLKGVKNEISLKIGDLRKWKLRRQVISSGVMLYGKYSELPEKAEYYALIHLENLNKKKVSQQMKIWRTLYGYRQKVGKKVYTTRGLIAKNGGVKIGKAVFLVPMEQRKDVLDFLRRHKVRYSIHELWSDGF